MNRPEDSALPVVFDLSIATAEFLYRHLAGLVLVGLVWTGACLPLVTAGPATLGALTAVTSLRESGRVDRTRVETTVRRNLSFGLSLGIVLLLFAVLGLLYSYRFWRTGSVLAVALSIGSVYALTCLYVLVSFTFLGVADGTDLSTAFVESLRWATHAPLVFGAVVVATILMFGALAVTTIGVVVLFPPISFSLHSEAYRLVR